ncbi:SDR family oxidoreductase [Paludibacterium yongneupense]|uniref:SDR family oxidoreductase n=1 Tax=Paludibacterium yongneupense TaxID=400061 RepID=UPI0003F5472C|nr:SDR family oxidoreductase [Paludibacterium yongneupense]
MTGETPRALIIGASRGLGLGLAEELGRAGWHVTATRRSGTAPDGPICWLMLDIDSQDQVLEFERQLAGARFDLIFINAGVSAPAGQTISTAAPEELAQLILTNAVSPVRLAARLFPCFGGKPGTLAFMSSRLGSLNENPHAELPLYAASKAALNMLVRSLLEPASAAGITLLSFHPGWVQTDMGGEGAPLTIADSVTGIVRQLERFAKQGGHHFIDYAGKRLEW